MNAASGSGEVDDEDGLVDSRYQGGSPTCCTASTASFDTSGEENHRVAS